MSKIFLRQDKTGLGILISMYEIQMTAYSLLPSSNSKGEMPDVV